MQLPVESEGFPNAGKGVLQDAVHFGGAFPHLVVQAVGAVGVPPGAHDQKRNRDQRRQRQFPVEPEQNHHDPDKGQNGRDQLLDPVHENSLDVGDVVVDAGHDFAGRPVFKIVQG